MDTSHSSVTLNGVQSTTRHCSRLDFEQCRPICSLPGALAPLIHGGVPLLHEPFHSRGRTYTDGPETFRSCRSQDKAPRGGLIKPWNMCHTCIAYAAVWLLGKSRQPRRRLRAGPPSLCHLDRLTTVQGVYTDANGNPGFLEDHFAGHSLGTRGAVVF